jgi:hypothetical protein
VNGRKVSIPSYALRVNDVVEVKDSNVARQLASKNLESATSRAVPDWLSLNKEALKGVVMRIPTRDEIQPLPTNRRWSNFIPANPNPARGCGADMQRNYTDRRRAGRNTRRSD